MRFANNEDKVYIYDEYMKEKSRQKCRNKCLDPDSTKGFGSSTIRINVNWDQDKDPYYWYKQDPKPWNDLFHTLKLEDCPVLKTRS